MHEAFYGFLELPVGGRFTIILGILLILYWIFGRLIYNLLSLVPFILRKLAYMLYLLIEIPMSTLHKAVGGVIASIDQGTANGFSKICTWLDKCYSVLHKPKTIHRGKAFWVFVVCGAYLIVPNLAGMDLSIFNFWENVYLKQEAKAVTYVESSSWFTDHIPVSAPVGDEITPSLSPSQSLQRENTTLFEAIKFGDNNNRVTELQERLKELGYYTGTIDSDFGPKTESAVKGFQEDKQLEVTGICDEETWKMLFENTNS